MALMSFGSGCLKLTQTVLTNGGLQALERLQGLRRVKNSEDVSQPIRSAPKYDDKQ